MFSDILAHHSFFQDINPKHLEWLDQIATNASFEKGEYIFREGQNASHFYLLLHGKVALEVDQSYDKPIVIQTLGEDEALGWSWLYPPFRWHFDARAVQETRVISLEAEPLRQKCGEDLEFGYQIMKRVSRIMLQRLQATRLQLLNIHHNRL